MQTQIGHIVFGVRPANLPFYRDLMNFLGWQVLYDTPEMVGVAGPNSTSLWFGTQVKDVANDYDGPGMNHIGISAPSQAEVDATVAYLKDRNIPPLFDTPRHRPEFSGDPDSTYYQVMFESPDRILFEVVYTGPKS